MLQWSTVRKEQPVKDSLSHTVWECKYHVVWVPKNRRKVTYGQLRREVDQEINDSIADKYDRDPSKPF